MIIKKVATREMLDQISLEAIETAKVVELLDMAREAVVVVEVQDLEDEAATIE